MSLLVVCTGNTCRSAMARVMLEHLAAVHGLALSVRTAGTHAVDGVPVGARTLSALRRIPGLPTPSPGARAVSTTASHRSRQLAAADLEGAELVVAMETAHVQYVRRVHHEAAARTGMLRVLARDLAPGPSPLAGRVGALVLDRSALDPDDDVSDPAGKDGAAYDACAADLWALCAALVPRL